MMHTNASMTNAISEMKIVPPTVTVIPITNLEDDDIVLDAEKERTMIASITSYTESSVITGYL